ncbi:MAG: ROK family protein [Burkholderiales bacterium]|nr:ROK family protein [Burkholderiales bacterium]
MAVRNRPRKSKQKSPSRPRARGLKPLVVDIGGTKVKLLCSGETEPRRIPSGKRLTPAQMVVAVREMTEDWDYNVVSLGYPGPVGSHGPRSEPGNLGPGWVGFDFAAAFECPVRIINDAAMQALGSYEGGRMLFLGLGTGLGSAMIAENVIIPLELGRVPYEADKSLGELLGRRGLKAMGKSDWRSIVVNVVHAFTDAFMVDYVVLGGGNAKLVKDPPPGVRLGHNHTAFRGGLRLWSLDSVQTLSAGAAHAPTKTSPPHEWRVI